MKPPHDDIERRRPVWEAFSQFFLDTELQAADYNRIAAVLAQSPYSLADLETILYHEVYPVLSLNLLSAAGEWSGFKMDVVEQRILKHVSRRIKMPAWCQTNRWMVRGHWTTVRDAIAVLRDLEGPATQTPRQ